MRISDKNVSLQEDPVRCCAPVTVYFSLFQLCSHGCEKNQSSSRIVEGLFSSHFKILDGCHSFLFLCTTSARHRQRRASNLQWALTSEYRHMLIFLKKICPRCSLTSTLITQGKWPWSDQRGSAALSWSAFLSKQQAEGRTPSKLSENKQGLPHEACTLSSHIGGPQCLLTCLATSL